MRVRAILLVAVLLLAGCRSSNPDETEMIFNPAQLTFTRLTTNTGADTAPSWNPSGSTLAFLSPRSGHLEVHSIVVANGEVDQITDEWGGQAVSRPSWAPDGDRMVVAADFVEGKTPSAFGALWVISYLSSFPIYAHLTGEGGTLDWPAWSPGGEWIAYSGEGRLWMISPVPGSRVQEIDTRDLTDAVEPAWSPDGEWIAYAASNGHDHDVYFQTAQDGSPTALAASGSDERSPTWSPDGRFIAYQSNGSGNWDIWIARVGGGSPLNVTSDIRTSDTQPAWNPVTGSLAFCSNRTGNIDIWLLEDLSFLE